MTQTLAQLGARTLRKLGVSVVALADQPAAGATVTSADVVSEALRNLGIIVPDSERSAPLPPLSLAELGGRAARGVGINPLDLLGTPTGIVFSVIDVGTKALFKLGIVASDEVPSAEDQAVATAKASAVHDSLVALDVASWPPSQIPASVVEYYVIMAANLLAAEFGKPPSLDALTAAQSAIRAMALSGARGQVLAEQKVTSVHDALNVLGLAAWTVNAVPAAHAEDYVQMAASLLAPVMGRDADKDAWPAAEARIRQAGMVRGASDRVLRRVQSVHAELQGLGLVSWTLDAIPASMLEAYAGAATAMMAEESGKPFDAAAHAAQMTRIRLLAMGGPAGQALAEAKVRAVHYSLDARGRTRWTLWDVPDYAEEPYVLMAAVLLAPEMGLRADPAWQPEAEMDLMRIVSLPTGYSPVVTDYF